MYEMYFFSQNIKKRFPGAILIALIATALIFGAGFILEDAEVIQLIIGFAGAGISLLYLFVGMKGAIYIFSIILFMLAIEFLPGVWGLILFVGYIVVLIIRRIHSKHVAKRKLLEEHDNMSATKAKEIIATMTANNKGAYDAVYQEAYLTMEAGFLMVSVKSKQYLLAIEEEDFTLYFFNEQKRIQDLVIGDAEILPDERDVKISRNHITDIKLVDSKKGLWMNRLHLILVVNGREEGFQVIGGLSARQIENFFAEKHDIEIENHVEENQSFLAKNVDDVAGDIIDTDEETIKRMRSSRLKNRFMIFLSFVSISFVLLGIRFPILYNFLILLPIVVTIFHITHQEYIQMDGSNVGKPSVWFSYLMNPILSSALSWYIILDILECVCPFRGYTPWVVGLVGMITFFILSLIFIKEFKGKIVAKLGLAILAIGYGTQIAAVISFRIHFGLGTLFSL